MSRLQRLGEMLDRKRAQARLVVGDQCLGGEPRERGIAAQLSGDPLAVVDRLGGSVGEPDHEVEVVLVELWSILVAQDRDDADRPSADAQCRHDDAGLTVGVQGRHELGFGGHCGGGARHPVDRTSGAGAQDLTRDALVDPDRPVQHPVQVILPTRVGVMCRRRHQPRAGRVDQPDRAGGVERRRDPPGHPVEGLVEVGRRGELVGHVGEQGEPVAALARVVAGQVALTLDRDGVATAPPDKQQEDPRPRGRDQGDGERRLVAARADAQHAEGTHDERQGDRHRRELTDQGPDATGLAKLGDEAGVRLQGQDADGGHQPEESPVQRDAG